MKKIFVNTHPGRAHTMRALINTKLPKLKGTTMKESTIEVKALVQFELPVAIKENRIPLTVITDQQGNPWWVANEVCKVLGFSETAAGTRHLDADEKGAVKLTGPSGGAQDYTIINEPGLYSLILRSRQPEAKAFKRWVTHDVLPEIRKTGAYNAKPAPAPELASVETVRYLLGEYDKKDAEVKRLEAKTEEMQPKAEFFDAVSNAYGNMSLTKAAKHLGHGPHKMIQRLTAEGILTRNPNMENVPLQRFINAGYFRVRTFVSPAGILHAQTLVTPRGLQYLFDRLEA
jgi:prophage antirepressor-like protein